MSSLTDQQILVFLLQILALLFVSKLLGEVVKRFGIPAIVGEILTGIILGATLLGRFMPETYQALFPQDALQQGMLDTMALLGILFLLLTTGFEVNVSSLWSQRGSTLRIGLLGATLPVVIGFSVFWFIPESVYSQYSSKMNFVLCLAYMVSISGTPIISKILHDLKILKTDVGLTIILAYVVNEVMGWFLFTIIFGIVVSTSSDSSHMIMVFTAVMVFGAICLLWGSRLIDSILRWMKQNRLYNSAMVLTLIFIVGIFCGLVTHRIGINAILGFFLAGIVIGNTREINENHRTTITQIVHTAFVPLFLATLVLRIDFLENANLKLILIYTSVAMGAKFLAAWIGATWSRMSKNDALMVAGAHVPGGSVDIILASVVLKLGIISPEMFVAIVSGALISAILVGPMLTLVIRLKKAFDVRKYFPSTAIISSLSARNRFEALSELSERAARILSVDPDLVTEVVRKREEIMSTGLGQGLAIPHGKIAGIERPLIIFARSPQGLEWDSADGQPVHLMFLIITPEENSDAQVQILALIAKAMLNPILAKVLMRAVTIPQMYDILVYELSKNMESPDE